MQTTHYTFLHFKLSVCLLSGNSSLVHNLQFQTTQATGPYNQILPVHQRYVII